MSFGISLGDWLHVVPIVDGLSPELPPSSKLTTTKRSYTPANLRANHGRKLKLRLKSELYCQYHGCAVSVSSSSCASYITTCTQTITGCSVQYRVRPLLITTTGAYSASSVASFAQATQTFCDGGCLPFKTPGNAVPPFSKYIWPRSDARWPQTCHRCHNLTSVNFRRKGLA